MHRDDTLPGVVGVESFVFSQLLTITVPYTNRVSWAEGLREMLPTSEAPLSA